VIFASENSTSENVLRDPDNRPERASRYATLAFLIYDARCANTVTGLTLTRSGPPRAELNIQDPPPRARSTSRSSAGNVIGSEMIRREARNRSARERRERASERASERAVFLE